MKRSQINQIILEAKAFLEERKFHLPPFAHWSPAQWKDPKIDHRHIIREQLGWDITDFGSGDFNRIGLFLFTLRNGSPQETSPNSKTYAEKILIVRPGQITPAHFHFHKMEDIINRGGGDLLVQLWNSTPDRQLDDTPVTVQLDSIPRTIPAGGTVTLRPGESICLPPFLYHKFWAERSLTLVGEVSRVNDDRTDNHFLDPIGRFPAIEEDHPPLHLLTPTTPAFKRNPALLPNPRLFRPSSLTALHKPSAQPHPFQSFT